MGSTFGTLVQGGYWCHQCMENTLTIAKWLSQPGKPITADVVVGVAYMMLLHHGGSIHDILQAGANAAHMGVITPL